MPTPTSEVCPELQISMDPLNVESGSDEVTDIILIHSDDANMDTFSEIPLEFDSSNSSVGTLELAEDSSKMETALPMLTDIAEETIYETEFFEETLKLDDNIVMKEDKNSFIQEDDNDISNILMETVVTDSVESSMENEVYEPTTDIECLKEGYLDSDMCETISEKDTNNFTISIEDATKFINDNTNGVLIATPVPTSPANEISNLITVSNNTNLVSGILESSSTLEKTNNINVDFVPAVKTVCTSLSNVIQLGGISNKVSTLQPFTLPSSKLVPISVAPANAVKRPATISVSPAGANVLTKVIVSQGKSGQPIRILPNTTTTSSPVKSITAAQAKQIGLKLQPMKPSSTKPLKQKVIYSNVATGAQVLKKIQPISKPTTPTKILPAPLVSKSATSSQSQNIILRPDYVMKTGTIIPKQSIGGQMITISNLQSAPAVSSSSMSPKKQVQYIKLINNVGSTNMPTVTTAKAKLTPVTQNSTITKIDKDTPIIVATNIKPSNSLQANNTASTSSITVVPVLPTTSMKSTPGQRLILPATSKLETISQTMVTDAKQGKSSANIMYVADEVLEKFKEDLLASPLKLKDESTRTTETTKVSQESQEAASETRIPPKSPPKYSLSTHETGGGLKSRKPCNCTRSQCLKLYCECFANGEFCNNCNCVSCHNNINHEENRQNAIRSCLDRNPQAFRPKIGKCLVGLSDRRHTKGCHCKRSGCLKNYCECYEAQIPCSDNCKCVGCKNIDDMLFATSCSTNGNNFDKSDQSFEFQTFSKNKLTAEINDAVGQSGANNPRHAFSFIKDQVVEATCQCLLAQAEDVKRRKVDTEDGEKYILEEFGRCLIQIIECAPDKYLAS